MQTLKTIISEEILPVLREKELSTQSTINVSDYTSTFELLEKAFDQVLHATYNELATRFEVEPDHITLPEMEDEDQENFSFLCSLYLIKDSNTSTLISESNLEQSVQNDINEVQNKDFSYVLNNNFNEVLNMYKQNYKEVWVGQSRESYFYEESYSIDEILSWNN